MLFTQGVNRIHGFINANTSATSLVRLSVVIVCIAASVSNRWVQCGLVALTRLVASALFRFFADQRETAGNKRQLLAVRIQLDTFNK